MTESKRTVKKDPETLERMISNKRNAKWIDPEVLEHLDPIRKMFVEELIRSGEWYIKIQKDECDNDVH